MSATDQLAAPPESELERTVREEQEEHDAALTGEDAEKGKLFEVPRVAVLVDESDPNVIKLKFSGSVELDRTNADDVALYNSFKAGKDADLNVGIFCAGPANTHRRDSEGDVDSIVQTKTLIVHSIDTAD